MRVEIDQSGKIEQLNKNTVIAFSNKYQYSVLIPKQIKQKFYRLYRGKTKNLRYRLYIIGIYYCLKNYLSQQESVIIDCEYIGKDNLIKSLLLNLIKREHQHPINSGIIRFSRIGKNSNAHAVAIDVYRGNRKPNHILSIKDIEKLIIKR